MKLNLFWPNLIENIIRKKNKVIEWHLDLEPFSAEHSSKKGCWKGGVGYLQYKNTSILLHSNSFLWSTTTVAAKLIILNLQLWRMCLNIKLCGTLIKKEVIIKSQHYITKHVTLSHPHFKAETWLCNITGSLALSFRQILTQLNCIMLKLGSYSWSPLTGHDNYWILAKTDVSNKMTGLVESPDHWH